MRKCLMGILPQRRKRDRLRAGSLQSVLGIHSEEATSADIQIVSLGGRLIKVSTGCCLAGLVLSTVCRRQSCGASCRGRSWWLVWQRKLNATWTVEVHTICGGDSS